jgi:riboflavin kinase/FMN adenylyltransferase
MEILRGTDARPSTDDACVATIGVFDGVHRGHAALFDMVKADAAAIGARAAIVTFEPHPVEVLAPERAPCVLTTIDQRLELFEAQGMDVTVVLEFNRALSMLSPADFVRAALVDELHVREVVVGEDFRFGHERAGDVSTLADLGREFGFEARAIALIGDGASKIGSSQIRRLVAEGKVARAAGLLGRPFALSGEVVHGDERGRALGFPTANLAHHPRACLPGFGVYAGWLRDGRRRLPGVINVGVRPTFKDNDPPLCEIYVLDFDGDLYGVRGEVEFAEFLRPEERFDAADALVAQMRKDVERGRAVLGAIS